MLYQPPLPIITGAVPGQLDPNQTSRLLHHHSSVLSFATYYSLAALNVAPDSIPDLNKLSLREELCKNTRIVLETLPTGESYWRWVPRANLAQGVEDEGLWPRVVNYCGMKVVFSQDQWDIHKLDPEFECFVPLPPEVPFIAQKNPLNPLHSTSQQFPSAYPTTAPPFVHIHPQNQPGGPSPATPPMTPPNQTSSSNEGSKTPPRRSKAATVEDYNEEDEENMDDTTPSFPDMPSNEFYNYTASDLPQRARSTSPMQTSSMDRAEYFARLRAESNGEEDFTHFSENPKKRKAPSPCQFDDPTPMEVPRRAGSTSPMQTSSMDRADYFSRLQAEDQEEEDLFRFNKKPKKREVPPSDNHNPQGGAEEHHTHEQHADSLPKQGTRKGSRNLAEKYMKGKEQRDHKRKMERNEYRNRKFMESVVNEENPYAHSIHPEQGSDYASDTTYTHNIPPEYTPDYAEESTYTNDVRPEQAPSYTAPDVPETEVPENIQAQQRESPDHVEENEEAPFTVEESIRKIKELEKDKPIWDGMARERQEREEREALERERIQRERRQAEEEERRRKNRRAPRETVDPAEREAQRQEYIRRQRQRRQPNINKFMTHWTATDALDHYLKLSSKFDSSKFGINGAPPSFETIPWPVLKNPSQITLEHIDWNNVEEFFRCIEAFLPYKEFKTIVAKSHRRFHPDRWRSRGVLAAVKDDIERNCLEVAANTTTQALTPIWRAVSAAD